MKLYAYCRSTILYRVRIGLNLKAFTFANPPGLADICLVPQLYNALRWGCDLAPFAHLTEVGARRFAHPAFDAASPENQLDAT